MFDLLRWSLLSSAILTRKFSSQSPHTTTACTSPPSPTMVNCDIIDASSDDWDLVSTSGGSEHSELWELLSDDGDLPES